MFCCVARRGGIVFTSFILLDGHQRATEVKEHWLFCRRAELSSWRKLATGGLFVKRQRLIKMSI